MDSEEKRILNELERMEETKFYQWFVESLQSLEISASPRSAGAPWEFIIWAYRETMKEELKSKIISCSYRLLTDILKRDPNDINAAETFHLSLIISHLQLRQLKEELRKLVDRKCTYSLEYQGTDIREQMLYHLESLEYLDLYFWKKEVGDPRFAGSAFLAMTRVTQEEAIRYFPHLVEASKGPNGIPLDEILQIALERPGMAGFCGRIVDLFSNVENMPDEDELPPILKTKNKANREKYWIEYGDLTSKALNQLGIKVKPYESPEYKIKITRIRVNSLGIAVYEILECSAIYKR